MGDGRALPRGTLTESRGNPRDDLDRLPFIADFLHLLSVGVLAGVSRGNIIVSKSLRGDPCCDKHDPHHA